MRRYSAAFVHAIALYVGKLFAFLVCPPVTAFAFETLAQRVVQCEQMRDVADEILDLPFGEWPSRPIADRLRLRQAHVAHAANEIGEGHLHAVTQKRRRDLRIEDARRHEIVTVREDFQIRRKRVTDDGRVRQRNNERA